jgi:putative serine protease PepD
VRHRVNAAVLTAALLLTSQLYAQESSSTGRNATLKATFKDVAAKSGECAVKIGSSGGSTRGFGVLLDGGFVVTTATNAKSDGTLSVRGKGWKSSGKVLGVDKGLNLALVKLEEAPKGAAVLGSSDALRLGSYVISLGGSDEPIAVGVVSAKNRMVEPRSLGGNFLMDLLSDGNDGPKRAYAKIFQHDGPIAPEVLGSPLVDSDGKVVGMNVDTAYRGSAYALGIDEIKGALEKLKKGETAAPPAAERPATPETKGKPRLGVAGRPLNDGERTARTVASGGVLVEELAPDGPAVRGGLHANDVILEVDGAAIGGLDELAAKIGAKSPGDTITLKVRRGKSKTLELKIELGSAE